MSAGPPSAGPEGAPGPGWRLPRLRVDIDGDWYDDDALITHPGILANLRSTLRRDADGYFIQTRVRIPVDVADVPWLIVRIEARGDRLHAHLNDGTEADIDPAEIRLGPTDVPYAPVKGGAFEARFSRAAAFQLLGLARYDERTGTGRLRLGEREYPLRRSA